MRIFNRKTAKNQNLFPNKAIVPNSYIQQVLTIYECVDPLIKKNHCKTNCSSCCYDYFFVTEGEFYLILLYLVEYKDKNYIKNIINKALKQKENLSDLYSSEYNRINTRVKTNTNINEISYDTSTIKLEYPCPFLNLGKCDIYTVRPLVCRLYGCVCESNCPEIKKCKKSIYQTVDYRTIAKMEVIGNNYRRPYPLCIWFDDENEIEMFIRYRLEASYSKPKKDFL